MRYVADVEDISAKTGNFKKFAVFVRMLASAIKQESDSVFVDLLTYSDLETLKSKKVAGRAPLQRTIPPNNKRYLILTYAAEFDRVHYPLPLLYEEPTVEHLQLVVQQLRAQLGQSTGSGSKAKHSEAAAEVRRLRDENAALQRQLAETEQQACSTSDSSIEHLQIELAEAKQEIALVGSFLELASLLVRQIISACGMASVLMIYIQKVVLLYTWELAKAQKPRNRTRFDLNLAYCTLITQTPASSRAATRLWQQQ